MRRELLRIARTALDIVIVARDTASTSSPSLNGSRTSLFLNVAANFGRSIEKSPYGSWCSPMMTPVSLPAVSSPTSMAIGPPYPRSSGRISVVQ